MDGCLDGCFLPWFMSETRENHAITLARGLAAGEQIQRSVTAAEARDARLGGLELVQDHLHVGDRRQRNAVLLTLLYPLLELALLRHQTKV